MSAFARVAFIAKTRNLEGSVVATSADGLPFLLCEGMEVHFVPPSLRGPRNARVSSIRQIREDSYEVSFEDVEGIEAFYAKLGDRLPAKLREELETLKENLK